MLFLKLEASTKNRKKQNTVQSSNMAMESMGGFPILPCLMTGGFHAFEMVLSIESHGLAVMGQGFSGGLYPPKRGIISWVIIHLPTSYSNSVVHLSAQTNNFPGIPRLPPPFCFHCFRLHHAVPADLGHAFPAGLAAQDWITQGIGNHRLQRGPV